jgi:hypothetical protein
VEILNSTKVIFSYPSPGIDREMKQGGEYTVKLTGTIHPPRSNKKKLEQLEVCIGYSSASLFMTSSPPQGHLKNIINMSHPLNVGSASSSSAKYPSCLPASWPSGKPIYLYPGNN